MGRPRKNPDDPKWRSDYDLPAPTPYRDDESAPTVEPEPAAAAAPTRPVRMEWATSPAGFKPWGDRLETVRPSKTSSFTGGWWTQKPEQKER